MRTLSACLLALLLALSPARAEVAPADRAAIEQVIRGQLDAFLADDAQAAYAHASPMIRRMFPSPALFLQMVRRAYAPVHRAQEARFRPPEATAEGIRQPVLLRGPDGRMWLALYTMERQADGSFLIDGCMLVELPQAGA